MTCCLCAFSPARVRARFHWAREQRSWTLKQWDHVVFTDESRFNIQNNSRRAMIWREPGSRFSSAKHRRKRSFQRWRVTCLSRDSNEVLNRPLRVRWGFRHSCPISRRNSTPSCASFYLCNEYRRGIYGL
ncbi:hypothetical protein AVEN_21151-1 [Araneus ventricosus]|uniref:Transposase Tc1-like domain-containing protein n=1 Tax=Araneus ventricosus TaxID=182803 RepID=A0A4Y2I9Q1_ARAVE|nr:hypothetical protein AVEN_21151-1 [Araneus ventricosus]